MQRMPRRNKPHNKTEIKKGTAICWGFGHCFGHWPIRSALQISLYLPPSRANQSSNQSIVKASIPYRWSSPSKLNYSLNFNPISETPFHYQRANLYKFLIYANSGF